MTSEAKACSYGRTQRSIAEGLKNNASPDIGEFHREFFIRIGEGQP